MAYAKRTNNNKPPVSMSSSAGAFMMDKQGRKVIVDGNGEYVSVYIPYTEAEIYARKPGNSDRCHKVTMKKSNLKPIKEPKIKL